MLHVALPWFDPGQWVNARLCLVVSCSTSCWCLWPEPWLMWRSSIKLSRWSQSSAVVMPCAAHYRTASAADSMTGDKLVIIYCPTYRPSTWSVWAVLFGKGLHSPSQSSSTEVVSYLYMRWYIARTDRLLGLLFDIMPNLYVVVHSKLTGSRWNFRAIE